MTEPKTSAVICACQSLLCEIFLCAFPICITAPSPSGSGSLGWAFHTETYQLEQPEYFRGKAHDLWL